MVSGMTLLDSLLSVSRVFCEARSVSFARASTLVFADGKVLSRLEGGRDLTTRRLEGAMQWFSDHWPANATWPRGVPRPAPRVPAPPPRTPAPAPDTREAV